MEVSVLQESPVLSRVEYTHGNDIYFGSGKAANKDDLTAHELTHVVQQTGAKTLQRKSTSTLKSQKDILQTKISPAPEGKTIQRNLSPKSPQADPGFQEVVKRTDTVAKQQKAHPPAQVKATEAQAAAVPPSNEKESKAKDRQVQEMNQQQPGQFNTATFKAAVMEKINAATPQNLDQAEKFKDNNALDTVKSDLSSQIGGEKKQAAGAIEEKTKEAPKTSGISEKVVTPLPPSPPDAPPADINAGQAVPKPKDASEVSMQEGSQSLDQQMADAKVTDEQLAKSNEPEFNAALGAKKEAQANAANAPAEYRQQEQKTLAQAQTQAQASAQAPLQGMQDQKAQALSQVVGQQGTTKGQDEQKRSEIAGHIEGIYSQTKQKVESLLSSLDGEVSQEFDRGASAAKSQFATYVDQETRNYKINRYLCRPDGLALWLRDSILSLPDEVNQFYETGRRNYINSMTVTIDRVANLVVTKLNSAKTEIANGKQEIQKYVLSLDPSLRQLGQDAAQTIQGKFDQLEQSVDSKQSELIDSLAQKYNENLQALDADIEKRKSENQGWVNKAKDAIGGTIQTILELKNMLMGMLAKAAGAIEKIIKDPIAFLGNLVAGIKQGFMGFAENIGNHLKKGLIGWLTGSLASAGVEIPKSFDLKGIFTLVTSILGLTYQGMRDRVAKKVGEKKVNALEKGFDMFILWKNEGMAGLWTFIQDKLTNLKEMVIGGIQSFVIDSIINAGVTWVLSLLNPASAFVRACKMIVDVIMFFVERGSQIAELVNAVLDSVGAIADGSIGVAAKLVEGALAKSLPVVIGFLSSLIGLGGISGKIRGLIEKARGLIDTAVDWVMSKAVEFAKKVGSSKLGKGVKAGFAKAKNLKDRGVKKLNGLKDKGKKKLQDWKEKAGKKFDFGKNKQGKTNPNTADKSDENQLNETIEIPFPMDSAQHTLFFVAQPAPSVEMASQRDKLSNKIGRAISKLVKQTPKPNEQIEILKTVGKNAKIVQTLLCQRERLKGKARVDTTAMIRNTGKEIATMLSEYARKYNAKDIEEILGIYPPPKVGAHGSLVGEESLPDGTTRESHHAPPVELAMSTANQLRAVAPKVKAVNPQAEEFLLNAAEKLVEVEQGHGKRLPAILVHHITHKNAGEGGYAIHSKAIRDPLEAWLNSKGMDVKELVTMPDGSLASNPTGNEFNTFFGKQRYNKKYGSTPVKRVETPEILRETWRLVNESYEKVSAQTLGAVEIAVSQSKVDGSDGERKAAIQKLRSSEQQAPWRTLIRSLFPESN